MAQIEVRKFFGENKKKKVWCANAWARYYLELIFECDKWVKLHRHRNGDSYVSHVRRCAQLELQNCDDEQTETTWVMVSLIFLSYIYTFFCVNLLRFLQFFFFVFYTSFPMFFVRFRFCELFCSFFLDSKWCTCGFCTHTNTQTHINTNINTSEYKLKRDHIESLLLLITFIYLSF